MKNIAKPHILSLFLTLIISNSYAGECSFEPDKMFNDITTDGKTQKYLNFDNLDDRINEIGPHLWEYPPRFENNEQRKTVEDKLDKLLKTFEVFDNKATNNIGLLAFLKKYGFALAMSYNLDWPGSYKKTIDVFERALVIDPEDAYTNLRYGAFLAGSTFNDSAVKYLKKAVDKGWPEAKLRLAEFYMRDKAHWPEAKILYEQYLEYAPEDKKALQALNALEHGNIFKSDGPLDPDKPITTRVE